MKVVKFIKTLILHYGLVIDLDINGSVEIGIYYANICLCKITKIILFTILLNYRSAMGN